ncbi:ABC transporter ATP-binding protein [Flagellimonas alvinocaridis]|uniref:ABC transporter ATP-binding protein n=1 Tax=Flagellimonas alvinocaridis TaxID=2530200 RepID=A0A4S8RT21_9FLAO|nr:ABC-F family ATP-binding cassette domain-containing protein [Allomuricauda alvinocaridis]THV60295.1 ABC transporter ATP-binding protein [Allomuricauda alvinocaridis]
MNLLTVENISKSYGELVLFSDISFGINKDQKIALIAKNGSGKTSILNIMSGKDATETGQVTVRKGIKMAFLEQEPSLDPNLTIEETILATDNETLRVISNYEKAVENTEDTERYQKAFEAMERLNAWDFETQYKQILFQLQLTQLDAKVKTLSGGQRKRLALANALLNKPDLLILDEPTNHLDLEMIEWLETYFAKENITLFMVTHDRYFLDRVCNEILELDNNQLYSYKGNYTYFLKEKESRMEREEVEQHKSKQLYKKELDWIRRQPKARTTKSKSRIDDFSEIKKRAHQRRKEHEVQLELNMERLGSKILELHKISKSYGEKLLLDKFDYTFTKGERVGIIGQNGTGKSTFLNIITQQETVDGGKVVVGDTLKFGYYTQKGIPEKEGQKVIDVIREFGDYIPLKKGKQISAQQLLERFLFDRKKQYDFVEKLSGGERKRLYLCTVLIQNPNFLILDEPTNDLDIVTLNVLESFLLDFPGCLIVVSHDRYFMDKIVDHLFIFKGNGVIEDFPGNYTDYRVYETSKIAEERENKVNVSEKLEKTHWKEKDTSGKLSYMEQREYKQLEKDIQKLEEQKEVLQNKFTNPDLSGDEINQLSIELKEISDTIEEKTERWFELSAILEG